MKGIGFGYHTFMKCVWLALRFYSFSCGNGARSSGVGFPPIGELTTSEISMDEDKGVV